MNTFKNNFWKNLNKPFFALAPMENVTDFVFREVVAKYLPRPDIMFTEFTNVEALNSQGFKKTIHRLKFNKIQKPIVAQIWGIKPENYFKSAKIIQELGFDGIDINMGCPIRDIIKNGACSALIKNKGLTNEIIKATQEGSNGLPVSVKTRIGFDKVTTEDWIGFLLEHKLHALTIHGRTTKQMSKVPNGWNEIKKSVKIKNKISPETIIIGNGDIKSRIDGLEKYNETKVDGIMVARGVFLNPWIFEKDTKDHTFNEARIVLINHLKMYDHQMHFDNLKKFFKMYANNFEGASTLRSKLMETKSVGEALECLK